MSQRESPKYRVSLRASTPPVSFNAIERPKSCFVGVSWENPNFNIKYIPSIMDWVKANFDNCSLIIADYLYRYSLMILNDLSEEEASKIALEKGEKIYIEYKTAFDADPQIVIYRWLDKEVKINHDYLLQFDKTVRSNKSVMEVIDSDSQAYLDGKTFKSTISDDERLELCRKYIIEEMAFINYQAELGINCSVYPGTQLSVLKNFSLNKFPECNLALSKVFYLDLAVKK
mgnify:CR=1 FL=1